MNDHISLLLQGYAAKRELVRLFQPEGLGLVNQPRIATVVDESIPAIQPGIRQTSRLFRENRCKHNAIPKPCKLVLSAIAIPVEDGSDILSHSSARDGIAGRALCLRRGAGAGW